MNDRAIRAITPLLYGFMGTVIGCTILITKPSTEIAVAAFSLAGTAIGVGGGATSPGRDRNIEAENVENVSIDR